MKLFGSYFFLFILENTCAPGGGLLGTFMDALATEHHGLGIELAPIRGDFVHGWRTIGLR
jgi:hypothetical protein